MIYIFKWISCFGLCVRLRDFFERSTHRQRPPFDLSEVHFYSNTNLLHFSFLQVNRNQPWKVVWLGEFGCAGVDQVEIHRWVISVSPSISFIKDPARYNDKTERELQYLLGGLITLAISITSHWKLQKSWSGQTHRPGLSVYSYISHDALSNIPRSPVAWSDSAGYGWRYNAIGRRRRGKYLPKSPSHQLPAHCQRKGVWLDWLIDCYVCTL